MNRIAKQRALVVCFLMAVVFTAFSARLIDLQVTQHAEREAKIEAREKDPNRETLYARRGSIVDIRGEVLAQNEPTRLLIADGSQIRNFDAIADIITPFMDMPREQVLAKLKRTKYLEKAAGVGPDPYIRMKSDVPAADVLKITGALTTAKLPGIRFEHDSRRCYPNGRLLCHVIGFANSANAGQDGIERTMDDDLTGEDGFREIEVDRTGRELVLYRGEEKPAKNGDNVRLTIDLGLQNLVETELDDAVAEYKPAMASIIMMRPQTGEILAMASRPAYDPGDINAVPEKIAKDPDKNPFVNRSIAAAYEPGSTFKIVSVTAALNEKAVGPQSEIFCENGYYSRYKLKDHHPYGTLTVTNILVKSSNIGVCKLATQLGEQKLYEYIRRFGFGAPTGVALPGEENGILAPPHRWSKLSISRLPMGHEIAVTGLQITTAMSAIANGGDLMLPQIVREVIDEKGATVRTFPPQVMRRVATGETIENVRKALVEVTGTKGTATGARVPGFKVAGKTGTAQAIRHGTYVHNKHRTSFVGFMPADNPEFTCLIMIDEPQTEPGRDLGGLVCGPIFSRLGEKAARYLGLQPDPALMDPKPRGKTSRR